MKYFYVILQIVFYIILSSCSAGMHSNNNDTGNNNNELPFKVNGENLIMSKKIIYDTDGSMIITGCTKSSLLNNHLTGSMDYFIAKLDNEMNVIFFKQLGKLNRYMCANSVAVDQYHYIYVIGDIVNVNSNFFITKFSGSNGALIWEYDNNNITNNYGRDIFITDRNDIYFGGKIENKDTYNGFYGKVANVNNCYEMCPADYNINSDIIFLSKGSKEVTNVVSNSTLQYVYILGNDNQGNVLIFKVDKYNNNILEYFTFKDSDIIFEPNSLLIYNDYLYFTVHAERANTYGVVDSALWKLDFNGKIIWKKNIQSSVNGIFSLNGITACKYNNKDYLFLVGYTSLPFDKEFYQIGIHDSFLITYDLNGNFINYKYWGKFDAMIHNVSVISTEKCVLYVIGDNRDNHIQLPHNLFIRAVKDYIVK